MKTQTILTRRRSPVVAVAALLLLASPGAVAAPNPDLYIDQSWSATTGWNVMGSTVEISPSGQLHLLSTSTANAEIYRNLSVPTNLDFEIKVRVDAFGNQNNWRVNTGTRRLFMGLKADGIYAFTSSGVFTRIHATALGSGWHVYRAEVRGATAHVYLDGVHVTSYSLQASTQAAGVHVWTTGATQAEMHVDYTKLYSANTYFYLDDFADETAGNNPSHWQEKPGYAGATGDWRVQSDSGNLVYAQLATSSEYYSLLHGYARNLVYQGRFKVVSYASDSWLWFAIRWNHATAMVQAGYDYALGKWVLKERVSEDAAWTNLASSSVQSLGSGWHTFEIEANEGTVTLYVDGVSKVSSSAVTQLTWGHVGVVTNRAAVYFDDIDLVADGRVNDGVFELIMPDGTGAYYQRNFDVVAKTDGTLFALFNEGNGTTSALKEISSPNHGATWSTPVGHVAANATTLAGGSSPNLVKLASGKWLEVLSEQGPTSGTFRNYIRWSSNQGATWSGKYWVQSNYLAKRVTMPGKVMQATTGRVFLPCGEAGPGGEADGGVQIYYSDDEGVTWTAATTRHDQATFGLNLQEAKVVQLPTTGYFKAYFRTDLGFLFQSTSTNNGQTWSTPTITVFVSPLCAFNVERDGAGSTYYMYWAYNDPGRGESTTTPRFRNALAVSTDGTSTWKYVMDVDDWERAENQVRYMNENIRIVGDYIYLGVAEQHRLSDSAYNGRFKLKLTRVEKAKLRIYANFPPLH